MKALIIVSVFTLFFSGIVLAAEKTDKLFDKGKAVYEKSCAVCHSYGPPPKTAPPIIGLSGHYHEAFNDRKKAIAHMVDFIKNPSKEKSVLLPIGLEKWGLMAPMNLPDDELKAVSYWIWEVYNKEKKAPVKKK
ncbi:MAG: cytochrome c [Nitrospiraceae bacterium]|nr:cytochrome c [Nitrospiraceae bacterium]